MWKALSPPTNLQRSGAGVGGGWAGVFAMVQCSISAFLLQPCPALLHAPALIPSTCP